MTIKEAQEQLEKVVKRQAVLFREIGDKILTIQEKNPKNSKKLTLLIEQEKEIVNDVLEIRPITVKFNKKYASLLENMGFKKKESHGK